MLLASGLILNGHWKQNTTRQQRNMKNTSIGPKIITSWAPNLL